MQQRFWPVLFVDRRFRGAVRAKEGEEGGRICTDARCVQQLQCIQVEACSPRKRASTNSRGRGCGSRGYRLARRNLEIKLPRELSVELILLRAVLRVHLQPVVPDIAGGWVHGQVGRSKGEKLRAFWARKRAHGSEDLAHFLLCHLEFV